MAKDILTDDQDDAVIDPENGITFTDQPEEKLMGRLMLFNTGTLKYDPLVGAGVRDLPNGRLDQSRMKKIQMQLEADNWYDEEIEVNGQNISITAKRKEQ